MSRWLSRCPCPYPTFSPFSPLFYLPSSLDEFLFDDLLSFVLPFREGLLVRHLLNVRLNSSKNILLLLCRYCSESAREFVISLSSSSPPQV